MNITVFTKEESIHTVESVNTKMIVLKLFLHLIAHFKG